MKCVRIASKYRTFRKNGQRIDINVSRIEYERKRLYALTQMINWSCFLGISKQLCHKLSCIIICELFILSFIILKNHHEIHMNHSSQIIQTYTPTPNPLKFLFVFWNNIERSKFRLKKTEKPEPLTCM